MDAGASGLGFLTRLCDSSSSSGAYHYERPIKRMNDPSNDLLADYPVILTLPIQWGDQDAFGHVNNTIFIRWFESARIAYFDQLGIEKTLTQLRLAPILASVSCNFRRQVTFPDKISVGARITRLGRSSLSMQHAILSQSLGQIAAEGDSTVVIFDYKANRSQAIPDAVRELIEQAERLGEADGP